MAVVAKKKEIFY